MSRQSKLFLSLTGFCLMLTMLPLFIIQEWYNIMYIPLVLGGVSFLAFLVLLFTKDWIFFKELMNMRTTKHGLNLGALIFLSLFIIVAINYIAYVNNKKFDITEEKLNSLSEQARDIAKNVDSELNVIGFYLTGEPTQEAEKARLKELVNHFKDENSNFNSFFYDPNKRPDKKREFNIESPGEVIITYKGKSSSLSEVSEEAITNALIKLTRDKNKTIGFLVGHGERDLEATNEIGLSRLKKYLEDASYQITSVNLVSDTKLPDNLDVLAIVGSSLPLLDGEIKLIEEYLEKGGKLILMADPGKRHNLGVLTKKMGVEFENNFIIDQFGQILGGGPTMVIGSSYSKSNEVTKKFSDGTMTVFLLASTLSKSTQIPPQVTVEELVKTNPASFAKKELAAQVRREENDPRGPLTVAYAVTGKLSDKENAQPFNALIFSDSDFASNQLIDAQLNRDLAMNSFAFLAQDTDLVSIRPKVAKSTTVELTSVQAQVMKVGFFALPLLFFISSFVIWFRRRGA